MSSPIRSRLPRFLAAAFALAAFGCSSDESFTWSANVAGQYSIAVTNSDNGCALERWNEGESTSNIPFAIEQNDSELHGSLNGVAAIVLGLAIGTNQFDGALTDAGFEMTAYGTIPRQQGNCAFTLNAKLEGQLMGDAVSGTLEYVPATSTNPDCASLQCASVQNFNGTRPPAAH